MTLSALALLLAALLESIDPAARATANQIPALGWRLLATRAYLRAGNTLTERWSWSVEQAAAFATSPQGKTFQTAIETVQCTFSAAHPGFELYVNPDFRSLEVQLQRWNTNESVGRAAQQILDAARVAAAAQGFAGTPSSVSIDRLHAWLTNYKPDPPPSLAAPGLSPHGQAHAVDFQVQGGNRIVAGTDTTAITEEWEQGGWERKLAAAIRASGAPFEGPLQSPREPWHYRYEPRSGAPVAKECASGQSPVPG